VIDITYGWTFLHSPKIGFDLFLPIHDWAYIWFAVAIITFVGAFLKRGDKYAYGAACAVKVGFAFEWFNLGIFHSSVVPYAALQGLIWISFALTVFMVSTWPERSRVRFRKLPPPPSELINGAGDRE
jgi:hypothetical protein